MKKSVMIVASVLVMIMMIGVVSAGTVVSGWDPGISMKINPLSRTQGIQGAPSIPSNCEVAAKDAELQKTCGAVCSDNVKYSACLRGFNLKKSNECAMAPTEACCKTFSNITACKSFQIKAAPETTTQEEFVNLKGLFKNKEGSSSISREGQVIDVKKALNDQSKDNVKLSSGIKVSTYVDKIIFEGTKGSKVTFVNGGTVDLEQLSSLTLDRNGIYSECWIWSCGSLEELTKNGEFQKSSKWWERLAKRRYYYNHASTVVLAVRGGEIEQLIASTGSNPPKAG